MSPQSTESTERERERENLCVFVVVIYSEHVDSECIDTERDAIECVHQT